MSLQLLNRMHVWASHPDLRMSRGRENSWTVHGLRCGCHRHQIETPIPGSWLLVATHILASVC